MNNKSVERGYLALTDISGFRGLHYQIVPARVKMLETPFGKLR
jgi:hypothetical protein